MMVDRKEIFRTLGSFGAIFLLAGAIRYSIQDVLTTFTKVLLIGGGVMLLVWLVASFRDLTGFFSRRSSKLGTNTIVLGLAVLAILGFLNFLGYKHHKRFDWTSEKLFTLSDQTHKVVSGLSKDVTILQFAKSPKQEVSDVVAEYTDLSPRLHYQIVDPQEHPELAKQYGVTRMDQIVVASGARNEKLDAADEQGITGAILRVTGDTQRTVCFVEGHGEKSLTDNDATGYSTVNSELGKENYVTKSVNLVTSNGIPQDCNVLVDAGPTRALFPQEAQMIQKYLDAGGKVMILLDPDVDAKLDDLFSAWNINASNDTVIDASGVGRLFGTGPAVPLVVDYGESPITRGFTGAMTFFPLARTIGIADKANSAVQSTELLKTSANSFTKKVISGKEVSFDPATDQRGPLSLGVAAEQKKGAQDARLVVIGDSDFAANRWVTLQRNGDLFYNAINWLSAEEGLISIRPKSPENRRVDLTESQQRTLTIFSTYLLPFVVLLGGIYIWIKRR